MTSATQQGRCSHGSWVYTGGLPREDVALSLASLQEAPAGQAGALREKTSLTHLPGCLLAEDRLEEWSIPIKIEAFTAQAFQTSWRQHLRLKPATGHVEKSSSQKTLERSEFSSRAFQRDCSSPHMFSDRISEPVQGLATNKSCILALTFGRSDKSLVLLSLSPFVLAFNVAKHFTVIGLTGVFFT